MSRPRHSDPLTKDMADKLFQYVDGSLFWKISPKPGILPGDRAGGEVKKGYRKVRVNGTKEFEHRVIFMMHHGWLPTYLDHIDGNPRNNRVENLRPASLSMNAANRKIQENNTSGYRGVHYEKKTGKFIVQIGSRKNKSYIGSYDTAEMASAAYEVAAKERYGDFVRNIEFKEEQLIMMDSLVVFEETKLTPRQLKTQRDMLLSVIKDLIDRGVVGEEFREAVAAFAECLG